MCVRARSVSGHPEGPYRAMECEEGLSLQIYEGVDTLDKLFRHAVAKFKHLPCLGTRDIISQEDEKQPDGKVFQKVHLNTRARRIATSRANIPDVEVQVELAA